MATVPQPRITTVLQWIGVAVILVLCGAVAVLWLRQDWQVTQTQAEIAQLKAFTESQDRRLRDEVTVAQARVEHRWRESLLPLLRQYYRWFVALPDLREPIPEMPEWLQEKK